MTLIALLKQEFPQFPHITKKDLQNSVLHNNETNDSQSAKRQKISILEEHQQITRILDLASEKGVDGSESFYELLLGISEPSPSDESESKLDDLTLLSQIWLEYLEAAFQYEAFPLSLLLVSDFQSDNIPQFVGTVQYLLKKNISTESILSSGLLHQFANQIGDNDQIKQAYKILDKHLECKPLIARAAASNRIMNSGEAKTHDFEKRQALNGEAKSADQLKCVPIFPSLTKVTCTQDNLKTLYLFFNQPMLVTFLSEKNNVVSDFLKEKIKDLDLTTSLYRHIQCSVATNLRVDLTKKLNALLNQSQLNAVWKKEPTLSWILFSADPALLNKFSPSELELQINNLEIEHIPYAVDCVNHIKNGPALEKFYHHVLDLLVQEREIPSEAVTKMLRACPKLQIWIEEIAQKLQTGLIEKIKLEGQSTYDSYTAITDYYAVQNANIKVLRALSTSKLPYPEGTDTLKSLIIQTLYAQTNFNLLQFVEAVDNPIFYNYSPQEIKKMRITTLLNCLAQTHIRPLQDHIIQILDQSFKVKKWTEYKINDQPFIFKVVKYQNEALLQNYLPERLNRRQRLTKLNRLNQLAQNSRKGINFIDLIRDDLVLLKLLLNYYPQDMLLKKLGESEYGIGDNILHKAAKNNPESLKLILGFLFPLAQPEVPRAEPEVPRAENVFYALNEANQMPLHQAIIHNQESLDIFLNFTPHDTLQRLIGAQVNHCCNALHLAIEHNCPSSLNKLLEYLGHEQATYLEAQNKDGDTPLHLALEKPIELFEKTLLSFLSKSPKDKLESLLTIENKRKQTILQKAAVKAPSLMCMMLSNLSNDEVRYATLKKQGLLHLVASQDNPPLAAIISSFQNQEKGIEAILKIRDEKNRNLFDLMFCNAKSRRAQQRLISGILETKINALITAVIVDQQLLTTKPPFNLKSVHSLHFSGTVVEACLLNLRNFCKHLPPHITSIHLEAPYFQTLPVETLMSYITCLPDTVETITFKGTDYSKPMLISSININIKLAPMQKTEKDLGFTQNFFRNGSTRPQSGRMKRPAIEEEKNSLSSPQSH